MLAKEYAISLYSLISDYSTEINNLNVLHNGLSENKEYIDIMCSKFITNVEKKEKLSKLIDGTILNFLYVLVDNSRFDLFFDIYNEFQKINVENQNMITVEVRSKDTLTLETTTKLKEYLSEKFNQEVYLVPVIDKTIINGFVINYQGKQIDMSIMNRINKMKHNLAKEVN